MCRVWGSFPEMNVKGNSGEKSPRVTTPTPVMSQQDTGQQVYRNKRIKMILDHGRLLFHLNVEIVRLFSVSKLHKTSLSQRHENKPKSNKSDMVSEQLVPYIHLYMYIYIYIMWWTIFGLRCKIISLFLIFLPCRSEENSGKWNTSVHPSHSLSYEEQLLPMFSYIVYHII